MTMKERRALSRMLHISSMALYGGGDDEEVINQANVDCLFAERGNAILPEHKEVFPFTC